MIKTLNLDRSYTTTLENAYKISYEKESNCIWSASFCLPLNDLKNKKVQQLHYVEIIDSDTNEYIGLFKIMPKKTVKNSSTNEVTYQCQHVLSTLMGDVLFKYHQLAGYTTREVLEYLMNQQKTKHWQLGQVGFTRYFHYSWENENLISALFSVPKPFDEQYIWTWDTANYPWTLNLIRPDTTPTCRIKEGHNLVGFEVEENPNSLFNRIYPLGAGEGVNQLDIREVNNGVPYLEDIASIKKYGLSEVVWVDKRFTDKESLKASAQAMLNKWKQPIISWVVSAADVARLTKVKLDELRVDKVVRVITNDFGTVDLRIMKESKSDITGDPGAIKLEIGSIVQDLGTTNADLQRKQQINELYAQGATNILNFDYQDNCDEKYPAVIEFFVDDDVININTVELTFKTKAFRAYSKATQGGGAQIGTTESGGQSTQSSSSGGGSTQSSTSGGQSTQSSTSGGGSTQSSAANGDHDHLMFTKSAGPIPQGNDAMLYAGGGGVIYTQAGGSVFRTAGSSGTHSHNVSIPTHTHNVTFPSHSHDVNIPSHSHNVTIPAHSHNIVLPDHTHSIEYGIWESNQKANQVKIIIDSQEIDFKNTSCERLNLVDHLSKDDSGKITRGRHVIEMHPDTLARIEAQVVLRVFIRSQLGGEF